MKITNASSKKVTLVNGKTIGPKSTVSLEVTKGTDLYEQIKNLEASGVLDVMD